MKWIVGSLLISVLVTSQAQAGFWDWLPGKRRSCHYPESERQSILPREQERGWANTPQSYPVEKFEIRSALAERPWLRDFRYIIVVNKSDTGPSAQTVTVFEDGYQIAQDTVSTGREKLELKRRSSSCDGPSQSYYSITATGYYPVQQLVADHRSDTFDAAMPYAMFYDRKNGLALHQVTKSGQKNLGKRASGGCTRIRHEVIKDLFYKVARTRGASIPVFSYDGTPVLDENGKVKTSRTVSLFNRRGPAYSAIVIIQDIKE
ncbi:L,D-transpeptidase [Bdellovibrio sp. HCB2-146]|uniref:L,D-transpeptidase n=1 Tax=Bdellovibrio sp. HCB2-146 TaxID=3394362 RepID=UPI0039BD2ED2